MKEEVWFFSQLMSTGELPDVPIFKLGKSSSKDQRALLRM